MTSLPQAPIYDRTISGDMATSGSNAPQSNNPLNGKLPRVVGAGGQLRYKHASLWNFCSKCNFDAFSFPA